MAATTWARERQCGGQSDVKHCHLLFHLPAEYRAGKRLGQVKDAVLRLVKLHGRGITHDRVIALTVWPSPDGKYLIKGGPKGLEKVSRSQRASPPAGIIHGKRCGVTENIGAAARKVESARKVTINQSR